MNIDYCPGGISALGLGCKCPAKINRYGKGIANVYASVSYISYNYYISSECAFHKFLLLGIE